MKVKMKLLPLLFFLFIISTGHAQNLRKKYLGVYEGTIPAYTLDLGSDVVPVAEASIRIELSATSIVQIIGSNTQTGTWRIVSESKEGYIISFRLEGQLIEEQLTLIKKGKKILRQGIYPQPDATLVKQ